MKAPSALCKQKHTRSGGCVSGSAIADLIGASINYNAALQYSVQMLAVTKLMVNFRERSGRQRSEWASR
jgi:hypothetical protein